MASKKRFTHYTLLIFCATLILTIIFLTSQNHADALSNMKTESLDMFSQNNIVFYDPCNGNSKSSSSEYGTAGLLSGDNTEEMTWNALVKINVAKISNDATVIAGIMGNLKQESGYNPFSHGGDYYGIAQTNDANFISAVEEKFGNRWCHEDCSQNSSEVTQEAIEFEIKWMAENKWNSEEDYRAFIKHIDDNTVSNHKPESYADLFMLYYEEAHPSHPTSPYMGGSNEMSDSGVAAAAAAAGQKYGWSGGGRYWQEMSIREGYAREIYDKYANKTSTSNEYLPASNNYAAIASAKNADKQATDFETVIYFDDNNTEMMKEMLENFGDLAYQTGKAAGVPWVAILVQARYEEGWDTEHNKINTPDRLCGKNNYWGMGCYGEHRFIGTAITNGENLGEGFMEYAKYVHNGHHDQALGISDPKEYLEKLGPTWVQGNINGPGYGSIEGMKKSIDALQSFIDTSEGQAIVKQFGNYSANYSTDENSTLCNGSTSYVKGGDAIAEKALEFAWPDEKNKCTNDDGSTVQYSTSVCLTVTKPAYLEGLEKINYNRDGFYYTSDCGRFVSATVKSAGADDNFPENYTPTLVSYMESNSGPDSALWERVDNIGNDTNLEPGDIMATTGNPYGHATLYVGEKGGENGTYANASLTDHTPHIQNNGYGSHAFEDYIILRSKLRLKISAGKHCFSEDEIVDKVVSLGFPKSKSSQVYCVEGYTLFKQENTWGPHVSAHGGCGPSSLAIVISNLTGELVTPLETTNAGNITTGGSGWDRGNNVGLRIALEKLVPNAKFAYIDGMGKTDYEVTEEFNRYLNKGAMIMVSGRSVTPNDFNGGTCDHWIVVSGVTEDGKWNVLNPGMNAGSYEDPNATIDENGNKYHNPNNSYLIDNDPSFVLGFIRNHGKKGSGGWGAAYAIWLE